MCAPGSEERGPLFGEPEKAAADERSDGGGGKDGPALRLGEDVSLAGALDAEDGIAARVGKRFKERMPCRVGADADHGGSIQRQGTDGGKEI